ncbi:Protein-S-isoprenylcysteine O-methyltransferase Ste14 [Burkholderia sp. D7]|nr:Protein-S-isoprenylcysteine O-methyltransferase Ste14 [Burkholderia sp. D7]
MHVSDQATHSGESRVHRAARPISSSSRTGGAQTPSHAADRVRLTRTQFATECALRTITAVVLYLFLVGTVHQYLKDTSRITLLFFAFAEFLTVGLAIFSRVPRERDWNPLSLIVTLFATYYFVAFRIEPGTRLVPELCAAVVQVAGVVIQVYAKWSLRRSFGLLPANRGVVVFGPYRVVRHPMYLGYFVTDIGFLLANFGPRNILIVLVQWTIQVVRITREERLLSKDDTYRQYMSRVRYRLISGLF